jgi:hypothetical protein
MNRFQLREGNAGRGAKKHGDSHALVDLDREYYYVFGLYSPTPPAGEKLGISFLEVDDFESFQRRFHSSEEACQGLTIRSEFSCHNLG